MTRYLVVGIYADNKQRWAESFMADDVEHAEEQAHGLVGDNELIIAAVITGKNMVVVA